jgi:hypothetical protein
MRAHGLMGGHRPGVTVVRVQLPVSPFSSWSLTDLKRKVAGYGWPGRFAKAVSPRGMRVRIPCLPLARPDGEVDHHASLLTRSPGFESWSGHTEATAVGGSVGVGMIRRKKSLDGEMDDHASLRTRRSGFESWSGHLWAWKVEWVPSSSGEDVPLTWGRPVVRIHPGPFRMCCGPLETEGLPDWRRDPLGKRASDEPCGFNSRPFRSGPTDPMGRPYCWCSWCSGST